VKGFEDVKPMVFAGIYPIDSDDFEDLRDSLEKLQLNDASLVYEPETSIALGFGFRCGFLGLLHLEIVSERLEREFDQNIIVTVPQVSYNCYLTKDKNAPIYLHNPSELPDVTTLDRIEEPWIKSQIITKPEFIGSLMNLCMEKRGILQNQHYLTPTRVELQFEMPLAEIVFDFYDKLKSISKGYASFDYQLIGFRAGDLVKLDIKLNGENVDAFSSMIHRDKAYGFGSRLCEKLKELIPKQQFVIAIQAAIGMKIISRETISAMRKDVTAKCYGGDISRKRNFSKSKRKARKKCVNSAKLKCHKKPF
jgi:GTP-binding protein LepA